MSYVAAYQREGFRQSLGNPEGWELDETDKQFGALVYRRGSEIVVVPNVPYNQPVTWRIEATRWQAARARERAAKLRADPFMKPWDAHTISESERNAERLERLAETMERTGKAHSICPVTGDFVPDWP
jgi:hypothetical protein